MGRALLPPDRPGWPRAQLRLATRVTSKFQILRFRPGVAALALVPPLVIPGPERSEGARNPYPQTGVMGSGLAAARRPGMTAREVFEQYTQRHPIRPSWNGREASRRHNSRRWTWRRCARGA